MIKLDKSRLHDLGYIISRNVLLLTNGVVFTVVVLLLIFGDVQAAIFIGLVLFVNMTLGLTQDIRAWLALENLQILTAPHVLRVNKDGTEESVLIEAIAKGDIIRFRVGDQIPCDGTLLESDSLEINEGLITGEATSLARDVGATLLAGSIITSGAGLMRAEGVFSESRISRMTEGIKGYAVTQSPIQRSASTVVRYSGYVLIGAMIFVVIRSYFTNESDILLVKEIGAMAGTLVPQGLIFAMTLLFAYGAAHLFNRHVLLQEVNATEKLGRIKNLCMDKTGTLTENSLKVERMDVPEGGNREHILQQLASYVAGAKDNSQMGIATSQFAPAQEGVKVEGTLAFSSWRLFGAVKVVTEGTSTILLLGAPDKLLPFVTDTAKRDWLSVLVDRETKLGKRVLCLARCSGDSIPEDLTGREVAPLAALVYVEKLRPGITDAIEFFQNRGVRLRIISGDNKETVRAVASMAGVKQCDLAITGKEMKDWTHEDFMKKASDYTIFARILPEQKEKLVEAMKQSGFTAMVGDGANDALALKKADLGIAMWDGAPATRQIASVVLMNNSFTALPGGVRLADSIIKNAEIFASLFFNFAFFGFFLFIMVGILGYPYPLSPMNVTLINYFSVGIPGILVSYWTLRPATKAPAPSGDSFLPTVLPYIISSAVIQSMALGLVFWWSPLAMKTTGVNLHIIVASIIVSVVFFFFTPKVFRGTLARSERYALWSLLAVEALLLLVVFKVPSLLTFFDIPNTLADFADFAPATIVLFVYTIGQYAVARFFWHKNNH